MQFSPNHPQRSYVKKPTEATGLSQRTISWICQSPKSSTASSSTAARNSQPVSTPPELQASSTAAGIPVPDKTSPPATQKVHPRAFIVDDFDKCVIRRKSNNFTRPGSSYPPLTGCLQYHYVNVSVLKKFKNKQAVFYLDYHKFSIKSYVLDVY